MKIAVLTLAVGETFKQKVYYAHKSKIEYCLRHGYDFIEDETVVDTSRPIAWSKILLMQKYLDSYDYVVWMDADAMVTNMNSKLEEKIPLMNGRPMMVASVCGMINTGVWFVRSCFESMEMLMEIFLQKDFIDHGNWEQEAFIHLLEGKRYFSEEVEVVLGKSKELQTYLREYSHGDFIVHMAGMRGDNLAWTLRKVFERLYPLRREDETEDQYVARKHWLRDNVAEAIRGFYLKSPYELIER